MLMILLCVHNPAASKVDAAIQTDATDDNMKPEIISTELIVSAGRKKWDWWKSERNIADLDAMEMFSDFWIEKLKDTAPSQTD